MSNNTTVDYINQIGNTVIGMLSDQSLVNSIQNFSSSLYANIIESLIDVDINIFKDKNLMNHHFMRYNMMRKDVQKALTRSGLGENAYINGDSSNPSMLIPMPSYTYNHNYNEFASTINEDEKRGFLTTRTTNIDGTQVNNYFDFEPSQSDITTINVNDVRFTGKLSDSDSILFKTKKLFNANKINTIISKFHTDGRVTYPGQIGSKYGESHGRNLLTKNAEKGINDYKINGYDNPYCRVWTHHYQYDNLAKTMRNKEFNEKIQNWGKDFQWDDNDEGNKAYNPNLIEKGENYNYGWKSKHNQERIKENTVLDYSTGSLKFAPQFRGGGSQNLHTKNCMFSIENLAWKDYDPYSFEQALSWEQRGPFGGRIMWFPPYNLNITETNSAKWNPNEFIGRGEPVYTYVNSDRSGTLRFTLLVDHPSSIDYASWYDNDNTDNDYHRYFAGCDNLEVKPTPLTDEYDEIVKLKPQEVKKKKEEQQEIEQPEKPEDVEVNFYVFFPNNYSGYYDNIDKKNSEVDAITYLLLGQGAQKNNGYMDLPLDTVNLQYSGNGYEMTNKGISDIANNTGNFIYGSDKTNEYIESKNKIWYYRIDSYINPKTEKYGLDNINEKNTITQKLQKEEYYKDTKSFKLNSSLEKIKECVSISDDSDLYTFAEVASVLLNNETLLNESNNERIDKLREIISNNKLVSISSSGCASNAGTSQKNKFLAEQRGQVIANWVKEMLKTDKVDENISHTGSKSKVPEDTNDKVNSLAAKFNRHAYITLRFSSSKTVDINNNVEVSADDVENQKNELDTTKRSGNISGDYKNYYGFKYLRSEVKGQNQDGKDIIWDYYQKEAGKHYVDVHNTVPEEEVDENKDIIISETQINDILDDDLFLGKNDNISLIEYSEISQGWVYDEFDISKIHEICMGDIVLNGSDNKYYTSKINFHEKYKEFEFIDSEWDLISSLTTEEVQPLLKNGYTCKLTYDYNIDDLQLNNNDFYIIKSGEGDYLAVVFNGELTTNIELISNCFRNYSNFDGYTDFCLDDVCVYEDKFYKCKKEYDYEKSECISKITSIGWDGNDWYEVLAFDVIDKLIQEQIRFISCDNIPSYYNGFEYVYTKYEKEDLGTGKWWDMFAEEFSTKFTVENVNTEANLIQVASTVFDEIKSTNSDFKNMMDNLFGVSSSYKYIDEDKVKAGIGLYHLLKSVKHISNENGNTYKTCITEEQYNTLVNEKKDENYDKGCNNIWVDRGDGILVNECNLDENDNITHKANAREKEKNKLRYDQEYYFYKHYMEDHPTIYQQLKDKIKYFNPIFHSMTPEGFNGRLTFLNQCVRQGSTITKSDGDKYGTTANNLAFGRPPYCVLRLGDFYYQMIIIDSINYDFSVSGELQWDLNTEGNGVQPMLCDVSINFKFIGGGDITGPVRRLQNALSFNYYANTSFYDNRADRMVYQDTNYETMGGAGNNKIDLDKSYVYKPQMYNENNTDLIKEL